MDEREIPCQIGSNIFESEGFESSKFLFEVRLHQAEVTGLVEGHIADTECGYVREMRGLQDGTGILF